MELLYIVILAYTLKFIIFYVILKCRCVQIDIFIRTNIYREHKDESKYLTLMVIIELIAYTII